MAIGPSIEDLLAKPEEEKPESAESELKKKIKEITIKEKEEEIEREAAALSLPYINLVGFGAGPDALSTIDKNQSKKLKTICFFNDGQEIRLGTVAYTPEVKKLEQELKETHHAHLVTYLISQHSFEMAFKLYETLPEVRKFIKGIEIKEEEVKKFEKEIKTFRDLNEKIKNVSITELITLIIAGAIKSRASDIHIEAEEKDLKVRYRIDGVLNDVAILAKETGPKITSRIKQLAKLKINVVDRPQDGRFSIFLKNDRVDVRVSALPTGFGESIVIRLLMSSAVDLSFEELGLRGRAYKTLEKEVKRPNGLIIATGPTGSGKTTTLYTMLDIINTPNVNISTIEDPVEYQMARINQTQVRPEIGLTFANGLRTLVRQDPDVVMVGEIRDNETAALAINASLTGHLVLSTLHTNSASGAIPRLLDMKVEPFLLVSTLNIVIAQRLVRRLSTSKTKYFLNKGELASLGSVVSLERILVLLREEKIIGEKDDFNKIPFWKPNPGKDSEDGYLGRIGIHEVLKVTPTVKSLIMKGATAGEVEEQAKSEGMMTMIEDGIFKAAQGITTIEEVLRVVSE